MKSILNIFLTLVLLMGVSISSEGQDLNDIDNHETGVKIVNDSVYALTLKYKVKSNVILDRKQTTWSTFKGYGINRNFWLGTSALAVSTVFYTASAWSDPVVYIESHKHYDRDYYNNAIRKRNIKLSGGILFTGVAMYFYYKGSKARTRWIVGPDGVKYTF